MQLNPFDIIVFVGFIVTVITVGVMMSRDEKDSESYFLAGRGLSWWLIGFSLIAANISTEQFVGMSGSAANWLGMAIASYEWMAAVTLVFVAFWFLPKFLKAGLYTIPEFLQYRFDGVARLAMAIPAIVTLVFVTTSSVIFFARLEMKMWEASSGIATIRPKPVVFMAIPMPRARAVERWSAGASATARNASSMPKMVPSRPRSVAMLAIAAPPIRISTISTTKITNIIT